MKKFISMFIAFVLVFSVVSVSFASTIKEINNIDEAKIFYEDGIPKGDYKKVDTVSYNVCYLPDTIRIVKDKLMVSFTMMYMDNTHRCEDKAFHVTVKNYLDGVHGTDFIMFRINESFYVNSRNNKDVHTENTSGWTVCDEWTDPSIRKCIIEVCRYVYEEIDGWGIYKQG